MADSGCTCSWEPHKPWCAIYAEPVPAAPDSREGDGLPEDVREQIQQRVFQMVPSDWPGREWRLIEKAIDLTLAAASQGEGGLAEGEACFLCGKPEGLPVSATGKHDACATAYEAGSNDAAGEDAPLRLAWDALLEGLRAKGLNAFDRYEDEGPTEAEIVAYVLRHIAAAPPAETGGGGAAICGMVSNSGPNGEPLACGYALHERSQQHSWATLPTWTQRPGDHCAFVYDTRDPVRSQCWRTRAQHDASDYSHDFVAPAAAGPGGGLDREAAVATVHQALHGDTYVCRFGAVLGCAEEQRAGRVVAALAPLLARGGR